MEPIKSLLVLSFLTMVTLSICHPTATNGRFYRNDDAIMDYDGYQLIRIKPMNMEQITILKQLGNDYEVFQYIVLIIIIIFIIQIDGLLESNR